MSQYCRHICALICPLQKCKFISPQITLTALSFNIQVAYEKSRLYYLPNTITLIRYIKHIEALCLESFNPVKLKLINSYEFISIYLKSDNWKQ